ncbi:mobilization protein [Marinobacter salinexigens]|uniref:Mobilization protein n=1 Tax=Marinobacter salinexigens TaxID=2919747 RepID=A0A5B0VHT4_9GAMM|nr:mobilization protein [Marinobacter salinexigens]KAA1174156.1 mobilization protein [Marinobacter salinexigens]
MSSIHFIGGEKGGVGKSMTSRLLAQYYIDRETPFLGFDSDASHGTFSRFYGEFASSVIVAEDDSLDGIIEACESQPDHDLIVDLAAQTSTRLGEWIEEADVFGLFSELGYTVYLWHVMDDGADSVDLLARVLSRYPQPELRFVVVQNLGRGSNFSELHDSKPYQEAMARGAYLFELGKLNPKLAHKVDFANASFWAAANNRDLMNMAERQRVRVWLRNNYGQLDKLLANE